MNRWSIIAGVFGFFAVAAGAFGAHALKSVIAEDKLAIFETAARYQMYHALALLALGCAVSRLERTSPRIPDLDDGEPHSSPRPLSSFAPRVLAAAGWAFTLGVVIFSGSLYVYALGGGKAFALVTPIGGVGLLIGWACLALGAWSWTRSTPPTRA